MICSKCKYNNQDQATHCNLCGEVFFKEAPTPKRAVTPPPTTWNLSTSPKITKVTLNLSELLQQGKITQQEYARLVEFSRKETKSHAFAIFTTLGIVATVVGVLGLFPNFFFDLGNALLHLFGARGLHFMLIVLTGVGALSSGSGFLASICAFSILTFIGDAGLFYTHAAYFVAITEPALTVLVFSVLSWIVFRISMYLDFKHQRVAIIFSRVCIFIVNLGFWIGSLWGSQFFNVQIDDLVFVAGWAIALILVGVWAAKNNRRWVVNSSAVFGSIHFYTQWFERLGASPGSLVFAGLLSLGILYFFKTYNQNDLDTALTEFRRYRA